MIGFCVLNLKSENHLIEGLNEREVLGVQDRPRPKCSYHQRSVLSLCSTGATTTSVEKPSGNLFRTVLIGAYQVGNQNVIDRHAGEIRILDGYIFQIDIDERGVSEIGIGKRRSLEVYVIESGLDQFGIGKTHAGEIRILDGYVFQIDIDERGVSEIGIGKRRSLEVYVIEAGLDQFGIGKTSLADVRIVSVKCFARVVYFHRDPLATGMSETLKSQLSLTAERAPRLTLP